MARLEDHIEKILGKAGDCLTAAEIRLRLNRELGDSEPYTPAEIEACADKMPNLRKGRKEILPRVRMHGRCGSSSVFRAFTAAMVRVVCMWTISGVTSPDSDVHARTLTDW